MCGRAAACVWLTVIAKAGLVSSQRIATRRSAGTTSFRISSRLALSSAESVVSPVTLPPGRLRLAAKPAPMGSAMSGTTIGISDVTERAASAAVVEVTTMALTRSLTSSAARSARRAASPSAHLAS
jgi:hypothetical protein